MKDSIPRVQQILAHMREQLIALRDGATAEEVRRRYRATAERLALQGVGRAVNRLDEDAYSAPAMELLGEAMRLDFVERQAVPSIRRFDEHKDRRFALTPRGREMAALAQEDIPAFCDALGLALCSSHSHFRLFLRALSLKPIVCPEITLNDAEEGEKQGHSVPDWANFIATRLGEEPISVDIAKQIIDETLNRRLGTVSGSVPPVKHFVQALNESFATLAFHARGVKIGAKEIAILKSWGLQLRILDQSRFVPETLGNNVVWLACDFSESAELSIKRREIHDNETIVAREILASYRRQALASESSLSAPYIPIFSVRAETAYTCGVTRALVNIILHRLSEGTLVDIPDRVLLHLGTTRQPASEPLYRRGGNRRYEMTIQTSSE